MTPELRQARAGQKKLIAENRSYLVQTYQPTTTDPITGDQVPNPAATAVTENIYCRIMHERAQVPTDTQNPAGMSTNLNRMIMTDWENVPRYGATIAWESLTFEIGPVDPIYKYGGLVGYQAPLTEA